MLAALTLSSPSLRFAPRWGAFFCGKTMGRKAPAQYAPPFSKTLSLRTGAHAGVAIRPPHAPHPQPMRRGGVLPRPSITFAPPSMSLRTGDRCHRCDDPPPCTAPSSAWGKRLSALCQKNCHRLRRPWQFAYIVIFSATPPAQTAAASGISPAAPAASPRTKTA